jgi:hypothetical protein
MSFVGVPEAITSSQLKHIAFLHVFTKLARNNKVEITRQIYKIVLDFYFQMEIRTS